MAHVKHIQTPKEYLDWENQQEFKHEYYEGEVFTQAGVSSAHITIALNFGALLHTHLKGKHCRPYISDMKLHIEEVNAFFYPDIMVTCDSRDNTTAMYKQYPVLIAEILSESTAEYDRTFKFACYRRIKTLQDYLLISQDSCSIEHYHLNTNCEWVRHDYTMKECFNLQSLDFIIALSDIYADLEGIPPIEEKFRRIQL